MRQLEAVIFDLDGVITDTAEYHYLAWNNLASELGISFDKEFNEQLKGVSRMESLERILALGNMQHRYTEEQKLELASRKNEHYLSLIQTIAPSDLLPGIRSLLDQLMKSDLKVGLASASKNAFTVINRLEIKRYFDYIVDAATLKNSKPDPEIFLRAAEMLNVDPENCIGIEDAEAGIEAIKSAGMTAVGVGLDESFRNADALVQYTSDITLPFLEKCFN